MALAQLDSVAVEGIDAYCAKVEVDVASGLPGCVIVGLADKAVEESRERVRSAIRHSGYDFPLSRITVNLTPSEKRKSGLHFDLPIALGILIADNQLKKPPKLKETLMLGGLSLDGQLQPIIGALVMVEWAKKNRFKSVLVPHANYREARLIDEIEVVPIGSLTEVIDWLKGTFQPEIVEKPIDSEPPDYSLDWLQIQGQEKAKRSAIIAACGGHNLLLEGPPGAGKTLLARGIRALLPKLNTDELIEVVRLHSLAGQLKDELPLDQMPRPFRNPHHSASHIAVVGGGTHPRPGEISLAHRGLLFLDELPEFPRQVLEALRQPLEDFEVTVARAAQSIRYPAEFLLVATMNPCPCGWNGSKQKECKCGPYQIEQYRKRVSGPILDRIDIYLQVPAVSLDQLRLPPRPKQTLTDLKTKISATRSLQRARNGGVLNSRLAPSQINKIIHLDGAAEKLLKQAAEKFVISGRGFHKLLKVAQTIADFENKTRVDSPSLAEALQYRFANQEKS